MSMRKPSVVLLAALLLPSAFGLERPDVTFKIFQFPANMIPRIDGNTDDWAMVPDSYAWDGYEYVGFVGDQYYYLGPGNVWLFCEPFRLDRFHGWERGHVGWRDHAVRNDHYRTDRNGHVQPRHDDRQGKGRKDEH